MIYCSNIFMKYQRGKILKLRGRVKASRILIVHLCTNLKPLETVLDGTLTIFLSKTDQKK